MSWLWTTWSRFWLTPQPAFDLGVNRAFFYAAMAAFYVPRDFAAWGEVNEVFWMPIYAFETLGLRPAPSEVLAVIQVIWKAALIGSALGLLTRLSTWTAFVFGFYLLGLPHNFGKTHHFDALIVIAFGFLALSRCGDVCSLDRWFVERRARRAGDVRPAITDPSPEYHWPIQAIQVGMCLVFFASGVAKLRNSGLSWIFSENFATILIKQNYYTSNVPPLTDLGLDIAAVPALCYVLAGATLIVEVGYPLALLGRIPRLIFVPGMFLAQLGIRILMGPTFFAFMVLNVYWIPWSRLSPKRRRDGALTDDPSS